MKINQLKMIIREVVREEIQLGLKEIIGEINQPTQQVSQPKSEKKIVEKKSFSSNSVLNDVLNETAQSDEWKTMGGGKLDSSKMNQIIGQSYGDMMNGDSVPNGNLAAEMGVNPNDAPDFLKKDYRKLMKAVDKKQQRKIGG
tara:strand:+ start:395 stop:820 length:426 start_codon:yes stop_codon:yes gene_type:complete